MASRITFPPIDPSQTFSTRNEQENAKNDDFPRWLPPLAPSSIHVLPKIMPPDPLRENEELRVRIGILDHKQNESEKKIAKLKSKIATLQKENATLRQTINQPPQSYNYDGSRGAFPVQPFQEDSPLYQMQGTMTGLVSVHQNDNSAHHQGSSLPPRNFNRSSNTSNAEVLHPPAADQPPSNPSQKKRTYSDAFENSSHSQKLPPHVMTYEYPSPPPSSDSNKKKKTSSARYPSEDPIATAVHHVQEGYQFLKQKNYKNALKNMKTAITLDPYNAEAYAGQSEVYRLTNDLINSLLTAEHALTIQNDHITALVNKAIALDYFGSKTDSLKTYELVLKQEAWNKFALRGKMNILYHENRIQECRQAIETTLHYHPNDQIAVYYSNSLKTRFPETTADKGGRSSAPEKNT